MIVLLILGTTLWARSYVDVMRDSCESMYNDRLMPAAAVFHLSDQIHTRRMVLEEHLAGYGEYDDSQVHYELGRLDSKIAEIILQIEQTKLVDAEGKLLSEMKARLSEYGTLERRLLAELAAGEKVTYDAAIRGVFGALRAELVGLTEIQETVGKDLRHESFTAAASASSLTHFQLGAGFILGLLASVLAFGLQLKRFESQLSSKLH